MTAFDDTFVPLALSMIAEFGASATAVLQNDVGEYDPVLGAYDLGDWSSADWDGTDWYDTLAETSVSIKIVPPYPAKNVYTREDVTESRHLVSYLAASGLSFDPLSVRWDLQFQSLTYQHLEVNPIYSGDQIALYELVLER